MTNKWISAYNFERCHRLVSAINTVLIHEKLRGSRVDDESRLNEIGEAKDLLVDFISSFSEIVHDAEQDPERLVDGVDPRTGDLARRFMNIKKQQPQTSELATVSLDELSGLVGSGDDADWRRLLNYLRELRNLLEDHVQADVFDIIGGP